LPAALSLTQRQYVYPSNVLGGCKQCSADSAPSLLFADEQIFELGAAGRDAAAKSPGHLQGDR